MCNLYRLNRGPAEIAKMFGVDAVQSVNLADEVYPGYPGLVVANRMAKVMTWGFPLVLTGKSGQKLKPKPVTNARDDKLATGFWRASFEQRRCLIPVSAWAEPEGEPRRMTRTWYSLPGGEPIAIAGLWRATAEWGDAYTMVMVPSSPQMAEVHDRMPVILRTDDWRQWLEGSPRDARMRALLTHGAFDADFPPPAAAPAPPTSRQNSIASTPSATNNAPRLRARLSRSFDGEILALESEDHYVRVHGKTRSELLLIRLREAILEMDNVPGEQTHRSWWVASGAVAECLANGRNRELRLTNGLKVPVARDSIQRLQRSGFPIT